MVSGQGSVHLSGKSDFPYSHADLSTKEKADIELLRGQILLSIHFSAPILRLCGVLRAHFSPGY